MWLTWTSRTQISGVRPAGSARRSRPGRIEHYARRDPWLPPETAPHDVKRMVGNRNSLISSRCLLNLPTGGPLSMPHRASVTAGASGFARGTSAATRIQRLGRPSPPPQMPRPGLTLPWDWLSVIVSVLTAGATDPRGRQQLSNRRADQQMTLSLAIFQAIPQVS